MGNAKREAKRITKLRYGIKNILKKAFLLSHKLGAKIKIVLKKDS